MEAVTGPRDSNSHRDKIEETGPTSRASEEYPGSNEAEPESEWSFVDLYK